MIEHFWQTVPGYFTFPDFYEWAAKTLEKRGKFVEVGVHTGQSAACLAVELANRAPKSKLDLVDNGSNFQEVMRHLDPVKHVIGECHRMLSVEAARLYADDSIDLVYIDANHTYVDVLADVEAWLPKVRGGGVIAGHDFTTEIPDVIRAVTDRFDRFEVWRGIKYDGKYFPTWAVWK